MLSPFKMSSIGLLVLVVLGSVRLASGQAAGTLRIYLARHGQTDWNAERRLQGHSDIHLNETGRKQAAALAERLKGVKIDRVYSSTLSRSRETAEIVHLAAPLESLDSLREQKLGKFEGVRIDGSDPNGAAEWEKRSADPNDSLDGGESQEQHYARVKAAIETIRSQSASGTILIVGHGGTNQMILRALFGLTPEQTDSIRQSNEELYLIEIAGAATPRLWKAITTANLGDL